MSRLLLPLLLLLGGCRLAQDLQQDPRTHDERLSSLVEELESIRAGDGGDRGRRERLARIAIDRLYYEDPAHVDTAWVLGVLAYEDNDWDRATWYLDNVLHRQPTHARAAEVRVRLALDQGNLEYASRLLDASVALCPSDPGLREALALKCYLEQEWRDAALALEQAERLGSPIWRVAYNRGLIAEARGNTSEAMGHYRQSIEERAESFPRAENRLEGLGGRR